MPCGLRRPAGFVEKGVARRPAPCRGAQCSDCPATIKCCQQTAVSGRPPEGDDQIHRLIMRYAQADQRIDRRVILGTDDRRVVRTIGIGIYCFHNTLLDLGAAHSTRKPATTGHSQDVVTRTGKGLLISRRSSRCGKGTAIPASAKRSPMLKRKSLSTRRPPTGEPRSTQ